MTQNIYDIIAAEERASDLKTPAHEKEVLKTEIQRITASFESRAISSNNKSTKPKM
jgi:hypothetical protein